MKIIDEIILYENPDPLLVSKQGIFPGIVKLKDNSLLALFTIGQAFDSADQRTFVSKVLMMEEVGLNQNLYIIIYIKIRKNQNLLNHYYYKIINYWQ